MAASCFCPWPSACPSTTAGLIAAAMDLGAVQLERDGFTERDDSRFGVIALDESLDDEDRPSALLRERLAFDVDLEGLSHRDWQRSELDADLIADARERLSALVIDEALIEAMTATALALGIASLRAPLFAVRVAAASAALAAKCEIDADDAALAVRLTLAHRATQLPTSEDEDEAPPEPPETTDDAPIEQDDQDLGDRPLEDQLLEAAIAALPPDLLASLRLGASRGSAAGKAAASLKNGRRGRPAGFRGGRPGDGHRLSLIDTLRAAAPWQPFRRRSRPGSSERRVIVHAQDFRIIRRKEQSRTTTIFVVDASGSSAIERLAEAKGAVELLLAECYTRRDQVALLAFRGTAADLLLPPTRSLVRAKRSLNALPGGGGTPLAAGVQAAMELAHGARRRGETPLLVFLTDGRANIGRDGVPGRKQALNDALTAAKHIAASGDSALVIDISARPGPEAAALAGALDGRYLPLPRADARRLSSMVASARER